jgi:hypothetical protein
MFYKLIYIYIYNISNLLTVPVPPLITPAMNLLGSDPFSRSPSYLDEDILIRKLLLTHDPDGRHLDSELLLRLTEHIMHCATTSEVPVTSLVGNIVMNVHQNRLNVSLSQNNYLLSLRFQGLHHGVVILSN